MESLGLRYMVTLLRPINEFIYLDLVLNTKLDPALCERDKYITKTKINGNITEEKKKQWQHDSYLGRQFPKPLHGTDQTPLKLCHSK